MFRHSFRVCLTLSAAAILWCASDAVSLAAKSPVPIPETFWLTAGKLKAKATQLGGFSALGAADISFSAAEGVGFPATGTFTCDIADVDPEVVFELTVPGTYAQDEKGKIVLVPDAEAVETAIAELILGVLAEGGLVPDSLTATILKSSAKAKTGSSTKLGDFIKLKFKAQVALTIVVGPDTILMKVSTSYNGVGTPAT